MHPFCLFVPIHLRNTPAAAPVRPILSYMASKFKSVECSTRGEILKVAAGLVCRFKFQELSVGYSLADTLQTGVGEEHLEIHNNKDDAIAIAIYLTIDKEGNPLEDGESVTFSDDIGTSISTGPLASTSGWLVCLVPPGGVHSGPAIVDWIRKKQ